MCALWQGKALSSVMQVRESWLNRVWFGQKKLKRDGARIREMEPVLV